MGQMQLPEEFRDEMKKILGDEYETFLASYGKPARKGLRLNLLKLERDADDPEPSQPGAGDADDPEPSQPGAGDADDPEPSQPGAGDADDPEPSQPGAGDTDDPEPSQPDVISAEVLRNFEEESGFHLTPVPWTVDGFFYDEEDQPSRHPFYSAGLYYLQEPSAMAPAQILPVRPGDRVLDLCAAPGGKTTELGARLQGKGLLVANEISPARVKALVRNVELFGIPNAVITNTDSSKLLQNYRGFFDKVLVDAPCSGEGMFRKDQGAIDTWSPDKVRECAQIQRRITVDSADMLRPGGYMVYSTCTFAPEEDELAILHLLSVRPEMELLDISKTGGRSGFSDGLSVERLRKLGYLDEETGRDEAHTDGSWIGAETPDLTKTCRLWPHRIEGEGHFVALLRKRGGEDAGSISDAGSNGVGSNGVGSNGVGSNDAGPNPEAFVFREKKAGKGKSCIKGKAPEAAAGKGSRGWKSNRGGKGSTGGKGSGGSKGSRGGRGSGGRQEPAGQLSASDFQLIEDFTRPYLAVGQTEGLSIRRENLDVHAGKVYLMPVGVAIESGVTTARAGVYLGELKKNRFEPEQELAMVLPEAPLPQTVPGEMPVSVRQADKEAGQKTESLEDVLGRYICLPPEDDRIEQYLHGNTIEVKQESPNGWRLLCAGRHPVGWGKLVEGQLKNKYPAGWRIPG